MSEPTGSPGAPGSVVRWNPWPYAIIAWFVLFVSGMAAWAVVAMRQNVELVRPDYYEEEIQFQRQLDRVTRTAALSGQVSIQRDPAGQAIELRLPPAHAGKAVEGRIQFYRPSNARLDFERPLSLGEGGAQRIGTEGMPSGLWKVRVRWKVDGEEYYHDQSVVL